MSTDAERKAYEAAVTGHTHKLRREQIAIAAMAAQVTRFGLVQSAGDMHTVATRAFELAEIMLAESDKRP